MNKFHISLHLQFKKDCNVEKLENLLENMNEVKEIDPYNED